jgi:hypothetical protein
VTQKYRQIRDYSARDNWRPLLSIADSLGRGDEARAAAIALCAGRTDEDAQVTLFRHLRHIFNTLLPSRWGPDRAPGAQLVEALLSLEDGPYAEWRGINDDRPPRKFTQNDLAQLLRPFGIHSKTIWPMQRRPGDKSAAAMSAVNLRRCGLLIVPTPTQRHSRARSYTCHVPETVTLAVTRDIRKELDMNNIQKTSSRAEVEAFLARAKSVTVEGAGHGRLVFGLDAIASRQPTWDQACHLQAQMFEEVATGGLEIQLIYYRGLSECRASPWIADARRLGELMSRIRCVTGTTQLAKILGGGSTPGARANVNEGWLHRRRRHHPVVGHDRHPLSRPSVSRAMCQNSVGTAKIEPADQPIRPEAIFSLPSNRPP